MTVRQHPAWRAERPWLADTVVCGGLLPWANHFLPPDASLAAQPRVLAKAKTRWIGTGLMFDVEKHLADSAAAAGFTQQGAVEVARFIGALTRLAGPRRALELGTGMGLTTYHILSNLPPDGVLDSVESDQALIEVARGAIGGDERLRLHNGLGENFIGEALKSDGYDLIFADTWPGKYFLLDEVLRMVKPGGIYVIDDMNHSDDWPDGHKEKAQSLLGHLQDLKGWSFSYYTFGTGVGIGQKHSPQQLT